MYNVSINMILFFFVRKYLFIVTLVGLGLATETETDGVKIPIETLAHIGEGDGSRLIHTYDLSYILFRSDYKASTIMYVSSYDDVSRRRGSTEILSCLPVLLCMNFYFCLLSRLLLVHVSVTCAVF